MATPSRLLRGSKPLGRHVPSSVGRSAISSSVSIVKCLDKSSSGGLPTEKIAPGDAVNKRKPFVVAASTAEAPVANAEPRVDGGIMDVGFLLATARSVLLRVLKVPAAVKLIPKKSHLQMLIEKVIIDCRFFTLLAVAGSLFGSVLCFAEGCFLVLETYFRYFNTFSRSSDQGHMVGLLIEGIDMFLVGTAMLIFGVGLYAMFVGLKYSKEEGLPESNFFGLFHLKSLPTWVEMESVPQAKSKIGHAIMLILQVGLLEKFKNIPLVTSLDLACFAAAVLVSSASIFLLSRLRAGGLVKSVAKIL